MDAKAQNGVIKILDLGFNLTFELWPEHAPQTPPCRRGEGVQYERNFLSGKPRPMGGELYI